MKYDFIQTDFSSGELSPSAQGHVDSDAYKAGLRLASNMVPTRPGSMASRAGGHWLADGFNAHTGLLTNTPVQHIPIHDSPFGDFVIEISQSTMRFMDRFGVKDWNTYQNGPLFSFAVQDGTNAWGDPLTKTVYLSNALGVGQKHYDLTTSQILPPFVQANAFAGFPVGTNDHWILSGKIAGDDVTIQILNTALVVVATRVVPAHLGVFTLDFLPGDDFLVRVLGPNNQVSASTLWDITLQKNNTTLALELFANSFLDTTLPLDTERIRAASFWTSQDQPYKGDKATFWVMFAGGPNNQWAGWCLKWAPPVAGGPGTWTFQTVPCDPTNLAFIQGSNAVAVYQDRLWYGNNVASGRPQLIASKVGFMQAFDGALPQGPLTGRGVEVPWFVFKVVKEKYTWTGAEARIDVRDPANLANPPIGSLAAVPFHLPAYEPLISPTELATLAAGGAGGHQDALPAPQLTVEVNGLPIVVSPAPYGLISAKLPACILGDNRVTPIFSQSYGVWAVGVDSKIQLVTPTASAFGGVCYFNDKGNGQNFGVAFPKPGDVVTFSTIPLAEDPLNLTLASPTGAISWINVLRGLMLGTTHNEKLFSQDVALVIDPATGQDFQAEYESNQGADPALPALDVNDKVLFVQKGRQVLRLANISISTSGGLVAEDVGVMGEHLTDARVRTLCFLKAPTPRVVFGFDDGSGAVMSMVGKSVAWSRLTLPAAYGGIYSVACLESDRGSELFIGTENGASLHWTSFESKIQSKRMSFPQVAPLPAIKLAYDAENPLPPTMDAWARVGLRNTAGVLQAFGLSGSFIGQSVWVYLNGQIVGPLVATNDGTGHGMVTLDPSAFLPVGGNFNVWTDASGARRALEMYIGLLYPEHRMTTLPLEGGNPTGTSQSRLSRKAQLYVRFVDSYMPLVNGTRPEERADGQLMDLLGARISDDIRCTETTFDRGAVIDIEMDLPLRFEVAALFGGTVVNSI